MIFLLITCLRNKNENSHPLLESSTLMIIIKQSDVVNQENISGEFSLKQKYMRSSQLTDMMMLQYTKCI